MSPSDYLIDLLLVGIVLRQVVPRRLTAGSVLLPFAIVAVAGAAYLKGFPTRGNDLELDVVLVAAGAAFGVVSGLGTKVWSTTPRVVFSRAGTLAAGAWVAGMGLRFGFDVWAHTRSGGLALVRFSREHAITSPEAFVTAFVLMAFAQVLVRVGILQVRRLRFVDAMVAAGAPEPTPSGLDG